MEEETPEQREKTIDPPSVQDNSRNIQSPSKQQQAWRTSWGQDNLRRVKSITNQVTPQQPQIYDAPLPRVLNSQEAHQQLFDVEEREDSQRSQEPQFITQQGITANSNNEYIPSQQIPSIFGINCSYPSKPKQQKQPRRVYDQAVRVNFTEEEDENLLLGIKKYGIGKWEVILQQNKQGFHEKRTGTNLKDRWRNIKKKMNSDQEIIRRQQELEARIAREKAEKEANQDNERQEQRGDLEQVDRQRATNAEREEEERVQRATNAEREEEERAQRSQKAIREADEAMNANNLLQGVVPENGAIEPAKEVGGAIPPFVEGNLLPDANVGERNVVTQENVIVPERNEAAQVPNPVSAKNTPKKRGRPPTGRNMAKKGNAAEENRAAEVQAVEAMVVEQNAGENVVERIITQEPDRTEAQIPNPVQSAVNTPSRYPKRNDPEAKKTPLKPQEEVKKPKKNSAEVNRKVKQIKKAAKKSESEAKKPAKKATLTPKKANEPVEPAKNKRRLEEAELIESTTRTTRSQDNKRRKVEDTVSKKVVQPTKRNQNKNKKPSQGKTTKRPVKKGRPRRRY
jgi:hypothetical protein